ncbi:hypothetical protein SeLEV6574_g08443, partial [Synchytrium endobioticum]
PERKLQESFHSAGPLAKVEQITLIAQQALESLHTLEATPRQKEKVRRRLDSLAARADALVRQHVANTLIDELGDQERFIHIVEPLKKLQVALCQFIINTKSPALLPNGPRSLKPDFMDRMAHLQCELQKLTSFSNKPMAMDYVRLSLTYYLYWMELTMAQPYARLLSVTQKGTTKKMLQQIESFITRGGIHWLFDHGAVARIFKNTPFSPVPISYGLEERSGEGKGLGVIEGNLYRAITSVYHVRRNSINLENTWKHVASSTGYNCALVGVGGRAGNVRLGNIEGPLSNNIDTRNGGMGGGFGNERSRRSPRVTAERQQKTILWGEYRDLMDILSHFCSRIWTTEIPMNIFYLTAIVIFFTSAHTAPAGNKYAIQGMIDKLNHRANSYFRLELHLELNNMQKVISDEV